MTVRLALVCQAATAATRRAAFPADDPLDAPGLARARASSLRFASTAKCVRSPALAAGQTAEALGLEAEVTAELRDCDYGAWAGRLLEDVQIADPHGIGRWLSDPTSAPHGGEPLTALRDRVSAWLEALNGSGHLVAVTHASVIKAALMAVLQTSPSVFWRIDVAPLSVTRLHRRGEVWTFKALESRRHVGTEP